MEHIVEKLKRQIAEFTPKVRSEKIGVVISAADGIAEVEGLDDVMMGEMVAFDVSEGKPLAARRGGASMLRGMPLNLEEDTVKVVGLGDARKAREAMPAKPRATTPATPVGRELI